MTLDRNPMNRLLMGLMLLVTATAASAEWTVASGDDEVIQYVDKGSIRRNGNLVKMLDLIDFKTVQTVSGDSYLSDKAQSEYDCKEEKRRILTFTWFGGKMGTGKVVYSDSDPRKWKPVSPDSFGATLWKMACGKK